MNRPEHTCRALTRVSTAAIALLILSACGGGAGDSKADSVGGGATAAAAVAAGPADACAALPAAAVQEVLGVPVRDSLALSMQGEGALQMSQCNYAMADNAAAVSLMLRRRAQGETTERMNASVRQTFTESGIAIENVSGVGDQAFFASNQLHVFVGERWYLIVTPVPSGGVDQARALAERAIGNL